MDNLDLSVFFNTKSESVDFSAKLSEVSDRIFENGFLLDNELGKIFGLEKKEKFIALLRDQNLNSNDPKEIKDFIDKLIESVSKIPIIYINIAFEPSEETLKALSEWFLLNIKRQFVFEINIQPEIIGGAVVDFNGKTSDQSVKEKFDKIVKEIVSPVS